jgi:hypothetical protein
MNNKYSNKCLITGLMVLSLIVHNVHAQETQSLPNIIFIMVDDMRYGDVKAFKG